MPASASAFPVLSLSPAVVAAVPLVVLALFALSGLVTVVRSVERVDRWTALLLTLLATTILFPSINHAASLRVSPDSVEYAVSARNLLLHGSFSITLDGAAFPPRYPLGFPLFVIVPSLLLFGAGSLGAGVYGVALCAAISVGVAYLTGVRLLSRSAGFVAAGLVLMLPAFVGSSQEVLSTAPAAAFSLIVLFCAVASRDAGLYRWLCAGLAIMLATACRPLSVLFALPVLCAWWREARAPKLGLVATLGPLLLWAALTGWHNAAVFGDPLRSGYNFWSPIPYDYPQLLFSLGYLVDNFGALTESGIVVMLPLAIFGMVMVWRSAGDGSRGLSAEVAALIASLGTVAFHLVYFWPWELYFEPSAVVLAPVAAVGVVRMVQRVSEAALQRIAILSLAAGVLTAWAAAHRVDARSTETFEQLEALSGICSALAGDGSVRVVTSRNPALVEAVTLTRTAPASRRVEYASKLLAPKKIDSDSVSGVSPTDHRNRLLLAGGAQEAFVTTAIESLDALEREVASGVIVLVDARLLSAEELQTLRDRFAVTEISTDVWRLQVRDQNGGPS